MAMTDIRSSTRPEEPSPLEPPQNAPGHYGPGYADPTRHFGTDPAGPAAASEPSAESAPPPAQPEAITATDAEPHAADADRPDLRSDEVGFRPPDRLPSEGAPESENAALIFERS
jgi:hypothetical protein